MIMKQKYILLILLVIIISTTSLSVLAVTPNLELTPSTQSVGIGNQATVNILVEEVIDLRGASITLNFDASKLQYASSADGGFIPGAFLAPPAVDNTGGSVVLDIVSLTSFTSGTGNIVTVFFERIATGDTNVTFGSTTLRDKDNITIIHTKGNGCLITSLIGDFYPDGCVDFEDLMIFALAYGSCEGDGNWMPICDIASPGGLTPDGCIDFEDLMIFAIHYGEGSCTPPSPPTLSDPGDTVQSGATYTVSWSLVSEATSYVLQEATSPDFSSGLQEYPVPGTSREFSHTVTTTTTYYYRVAAINSRGQGGWSNVEDIIVLPDSGNKIFLQSGGTLNGTPINPSDPVLTVNTGASITGTLNVQAIYSGPSGNVVPFGYTPSWGSHSSSYVTVVSDLPVGTSPYDVSINLIAPTTPGTYYLTFASNAEMNLGWTMSQTNWTTGSYSWDDGKDIADLTEPELQSSLSTGYLSLDMLVGSTYNKSNYGIAYVKFEVTEVMIYEKIFLQSGGNLNGTSINPSDPVLTVNTGASITGTLNVQVIRTGNPTCIEPFGYTPSWGSHNSSYVTVVSDLPVGTSPYNVSIDLNAPTTSGTYYLIFAASPEMNLGWTMSQTNWTTGTMSWDDGNDIADLTEPELQDSISTGYLYLDMLTGSTYSKSNYGIAYVKINVGTAKPTVTTQAATNIETNSVIANGTITSDGGSNIIERGFEYGLTQTPTWSVKENGTDLGTGAFSNTISGLNSDTTYWVKAYAVNNEGKSINEDWKEFHTPPDNIIITNSATFTCDGQQPVTSDCNITLQY